MSLGKLGVQQSFLSLLDHLHKVLPQLVDLSKVGMRLADALNERPLFCRELRLVFDKQPGRLAGGAACRFLPRARSGGPGKRARQSPMS